MNIATLLRDHTMTLSFCVRNKLSAIRGLILLGAFFGSGVIFAAECKVGDRWYPYNSPECGGSNRANTYSTDTDYSEVKSDKDNRNYQICKKFADGIADLIVDGNKSGIDRSMLSERLQSLYSTASGEQVINHMLYLNQISKDISRSELAASGTQICMSRR